MVRNYLNPGERNDLGELYENYVFRYFLERIEPYDLKFWRNINGQEVDFVLRDQSAFEVKWNANKIVESKYKAFTGLYPQLPLKFISRINRREGDLLF